MTEAEAVPQRRGRLRATALACAAFVAAIAILTMAGWLMGIPALVRVRHGVSATQFNAAASFLLLAGALAALAWRRARMGLALAGGASLVAGVTLLEHVLSWSPGIDDLVGRIGLDVAFLAEVGLPGRMAPNTALGLFLSALALVAVASTRLSKARLGLCAAASLAASTIGAVALAGYMVGIPTAYGWGDLRGMAPQSAVLLVVMGIGSLSLVALGARRSGLDAARVFPALAGTTVAFAALLMWVALVDHDERGLRTMLRHQANTLAANVARGMDDRARVVDRLGQQRVLVDDYAMGTRSAAAADILRDFPGIVGVLRLDSAGIVRWRMAEQASDADSVGSHFAGTPRLAALLEAARVRGRAVVSAPVARRTGHPSVLLVDANAPVAGSAPDFIVAEVIPDDMLREFVSGEFLSLYSYSLTDGGVLLAGELDANGTSVEDWDASWPVDVRERHWRVSVAPTQHLLDENSSALPGTFLTVALLCALFTGWVVRAAQMAAAQSAALTAVAMDLAAQVDARREAEVLRDEHADMLGVQTAELALQNRELQSTASALGRQRDELGRAHEFSAALVRSTVDAVAAFDRAGRVQAWNPPMEWLTGYAQDVAASAQVGALLPFLEHRDEVRLLREALAGTPTTLRALAANHPTHQQEMWLDVTVTPMRSADGDVVGALLVARDVTEEKRVAEVILAAKDAAEQANRTKSEFLARMSHELRTPLNAVIGFTNVIARNQKGHLSVTDLSYLDRIGANGKHLLTLINSVLDLSKIESGRDSATLSATSISALVRDTVAELEVRATGAGLHLNADAAGDATAVTDAGKLKQVLINLIGNAIKFTPRDGHVTVSVRTNPATGHATRIDVTDTGIGIPAERLDAVFEAFEQADSQIVHTYGGTGLGLAISKKLCVLMGHELVVSSEPGVGSAFSILLKAEDERTRGREGERTA